MCVLFFVFKQKTAYELRISDWSSDVCSSDLRVDIHQRFEYQHLAVDPAIGNGAGGIGGAERTDQHLALRMDRRAAGIAELIPAAHVRSRQLMAMIGFDRQRPGLVDAQARKSVVEGKGVVVRVTLGGRRFIKK